MRGRRIIVPQICKVMRRIVIDKDEKCTRAALMEDADVAEFMDYGAGRESCIGEIYIGMVEAVTKSAFAFVDIGHERNAFLNLNDNKDRHMADRVKAGRPVAIQVTKDAYRDKGAYATTKLNWPGRFFVIETVSDAADAGVNLSKKIDRADERERLMDITSALLAKNAADLANKRIVVRTDAANAATSYLETEFAELAGIVAHTKTLIAEALADDFDRGRLPLLAHRPHASPCLKIVAELMKGALQIDEIVLNDEAEFKLLADIHGKRGVNVTLLKGSAFLAYDLAKAYETTKFRLVRLPSGGHIVIERTEACVVVDVNSGQSTGHKNLEGMALKTNIEAAHEAAKQLRLRNLGGIIIIDFIRMSDPENNMILTQELKNALSKDPAITTVEGITKLGLMELTRKRR